MQATRIGTVGADLARLFEAGATGPLGDADLLRRFVDGRGGPASEAAFAALVDRHEGLVRGVGRRVLRDPHAADDVAQAVFLALSRKARTIRCDGSIGPWLYGVAVRLALRARARGSRRPAELEETDPAGPAPRPGPAERAEVMAAIDAEIARLPGRDRAAVVLCHVEGLDHREAARRLRCPLGTLESRLHRARARLRRALSRRGLAPAGGLALTLSGLRSHAEVPALLLSATTRPFARQIAMKTLAGLAAVALLAGGIGAGATALAPEATAAADEPARPPTPPPGPSVGDQIRAILAEWNVAEWKHGVALAVVPSRALAEKLYDAYEAKAEECSSRLLPLVESRPDDPAALDAMFWHISKYWGSSTHFEKNHPFDRSVNTLIRHFADEPRMAWRVLVSRNNIPERVADRLLPGLAGAARRRESKGLALLALAEHLEDKEKLVLLAQKSGDKAKLRRFGEAYVQALRGSDAAALRREAEATFARVVAEFGDVRLAGRDPGDPDFPIWVVPGPIGDEAAVHLAELRGVVIGKPAPDLAWSNRDGSTSRLSDLRGRVVVLKFRREGDDARGRRDSEFDARLAHAMKGRPFALVDFSAKSPLPFVRADGTEAVPADAAIGDRLGVRRFPATVLIDADGVLRFRCGSSVLLDGYLRKLVEEAEAKVARR